MIKNLKKRLDNTVDDTALNRNFYFIFSDIDKIQEGIGPKIGNFFQFFSAFITGFAIGFFYGWKLTLVILSVSPLMAGAAATFGKVQFCVFTVKPHLARLHLSGLFSCLDTLRLYISKVTLLSA